MNGPGNGDPPRKGRGYPPVEHQFKPGQSGNPRGRPRGAKSRSKQDVEAAGLNDFERLFLEEAARTIPTQDGTKLTTMAAVVRSGNMGAIKGERLKQQSFVKHASEIMGKVAQAKQSLWDTVIDYQTMAPIWLERATRRGIPFDLPVDAEDIYLDYATMEISVRGPIGAGEQREWNRMLALMNKLRADILRQRRIVAADPESEAEHRHLLRMTGMFAEMNAKLPDRYKRKPLPHSPMAHTLPWPTAWTEQWAD